VLQELAKLIVRDGEGASKAGAGPRSTGGQRERCLTVARSIATSALVKTAFFGADANWGGSSPRPATPGWISIRSWSASASTRVAMVERGLGLGTEQEAKATGVLKQGRIHRHVDLGLGNGSAWYYTYGLELRVCQDQRRLPLLSGR